jgi:predicted amidohydrolase
MGDSVMKIAGVQMDVAIEDVDLNLTAMVGWLGEATAGGEVRTAVLKGFAAAL